jgi:hypothetical protein
MSDFGFRLGIINIAADTIEYKNTSWGIEIRSELMKDDLVSPCGMSLNFSVDGQNATLVGKSKYTSLDTNEYYPLPTQTLYTAVTGTSNANMAWDPVTIGIKGIVSKKLLFLNPFVGVGVDINLGKMKTSMGTSGNVTVTDNSGNSTTQIFNMTGTKEATFPAGNLRLLGGLEIDIFIVKLNIGAESNLKDYAATGGLRFQF